MHLIYSLNPHADKKEAVYPNLPKLTLTEEMPFSMTDRSRISHNLSQQLSQV